MRLTIAKDKKEKFERILSDIYSIQGIITREDKRNYSVYYFFYRNDLMKALHIEKLLEAK